MSQTEFIMTYLVGGLACAIAGYIIGAQRAESEAEKMRRWWFRRENRLNRQRK